MTPRKPADASTHPCRIPQCGTQIPLDYLMCRPHWWAVPRPIRQAVWDTWRGGAGVLDPGYRAAVRVAVRAVTGQDGGES